MIPPPPIDAIPCVTTSWAELTSLKVGLGKLQLFRPENIDQLILLFKNFSDVFILGGGTNLIGSDVDHFERAVIQLSAPEFQNFEIQDDTLIAGAGISLARLARETLNKGYDSFLNFIGIPGTLGGALFGNAGAHQSAIFDTLIEVKILHPDGTIETLVKNKISHGYRFAKFPEKSVLISAVFQLQKTKNQAQIEHQINELKNWRNTFQPKGFTAGSVFKNPPHFSAGKLIESTHLKNFKFKSFEISPLHANFIVNHAPASANDLVDLMQFIRYSVYLQHTIELQSELRSVEKEHLIMLQSEFQKLTITVVYGGHSSEREISIKSGRCVAQALRDAHFNVKEVDLPRCELTDELKNAELVFPVLHGGFGENGNFQALLENAKIPFVGSGSAACKLIMNKIETKKVLDAHGIPNAAWVRIAKDSQDHSFPAHMKLPVVVKAPNEGSSVGVSIVNTPEEWDAALKLAFQYDDEALVEAFIDGIEVTCGIIDGKPLPLIELRFCGKFYDYDAKYTYKNGATQYLCPPPDISDEIQAETQKIAVEFAKACNAEPLVRVDFIIDKANKPFVLEGNAIPGFTDTSLVPKSAKQSGVEFPELCASLVTQAARRFNLITPSPK